MTFPLQAQFAAGAELTTQKLTIDPDDTTSGSGEVNGAHSSQNMKTAMYSVSVTISAPPSHAAARLASTRAAFAVRLAIAPHHSPTRPYVEGLIGGLEARSSLSNKFTGHYPDWLFVAGNDAAVTPHIDWRVFEYCHATSFGEVIRNQFSTGISFRFYKLQRRKRI